MLRITSNIRSRSVYASLFALSLIVLAHNTHAAVETTDSEELRNRARQEALDRERQQQAPSVNLEGNAPKAEPVQFPTGETPCFTTQHIILEIPAKASAAAQHFGATQSRWDAFHFVQVYLDQFKGQCIGREGINYIIRGVSEKIFEHGYSTTRVSIPEQDMLSGTLKLTLVPGIIHELRFADKNTAGTWKNAFPTSSGKLLNLRDLEQGLEQMKRVTSQEVDMQILPAGDLGESDVVISVNRTKPWKTVMSLDDSGAKGTGKLQAGLQVGWDNLFGANDLLNIGTTSDAERDGYARGTQGDNFSYSVPYGYWTTSLSGSDSQYHQRVSGASQSFVSSGKTQNFEAKVSYLFYRDQFSKDSVQFRTARRWSHSYVDDTEVDVQKRDTTLAEIALIHKHNIGQAQIDTTLAYRKGVSWFGAQSDPADLPDTSPRYNYSLETLDFTLSVPFRLTERPFSYSATIRAQNTNSPLYVDEMFSIGNRWTVRGFDGELPLSAERGFFLRNEIDMPIADTMQSVYAGLDYGKVYGENVATLLGDHLAGAVLGLRGNMVRGLVYEIFAGWSIYKPQDYPTAKPATGFNLTYQL
jgi:hemolysin activation/secretion protein